MVAVAEQDTSFYRDVIRLAEDTVIEGGKRTDPSDYYNYMEAPTPPRWEADFNGLHVTVRHNNLGKHESAPYSVDHKVEKYGAKRINIRPCDRILGGLTISYHQTVDGEFASIEAELHGSDLLLMELQEYVESSAPIR